MLSQKAGDVMDVFLVPGIPLENSNSHRSIIPGFVNYGFGSEAYIVAFLMVELLGRLCSRTLNMDLQIKSKAEAAGFTYVPMYDAFKGHELCTKRPFFNAVSLPPQQSFHPNILGQLELQQLILKRSLAN